MGTGSGLQSAQLTLSFGLYPAPSCSPLKTAPFSTCTYTQYDRMAKEQAEPVIIADEGGGEPEGAVVQVDTKWQGTEADRHDMRVIGRPQQLRRNFQLTTILGFGCTLISTWEINITYEYNLGLQLHQDSAQAWPAMLTGSSTQHLWIFLDK